MIECAVTIRCDEPGCTEALVTTEWGVGSSWTRVGTALKEAQWGMYGSTFNPLGLDIYKCPIHREES